MSSILVATPLTPNMLSTITFLLALTAAWMMGQTWFVAGALLMHVASVLDGCDGEVARLKYQTSRLGGWLDTVYDDISNSVFAVMTGVGLYSFFGGDVRGQVLLGMAVLGLLLALPALAVTYTRLVRANTSDSGALEWGDDEGASPLRRFLLRYLSPLVKRDAYLLIFLVFAIVGLPWAIVVFYFIGSAIASATILTQVMRGAGKTVSPAVQKVEPPAH
jgi:phosphatidylglycerophosphate synthase